MTILQKDLDNHKLWLRTNGREGSPIEERWVSHGGTFDGTSLAHSTFHWCSFNHVTLKGVSFVDADLQGTTFHYATLERVNFKNANLADTTWAGSKMTGCNFSGTKGLLDPSDWMASNFVTDEHGYIVYRSLIGEYTKPTGWGRTAGCFLTEVASPDRGSDCACGVNFATLQWVKLHYSYDGIIWKCRIHWRDLPGVVVPYSTTGKARCSRLELLEEVVG